jgi:hypothetical protein
MGSCPFVILRHEIDAFTPVVSAANLVVLYRFHVITVVVFQRFQVFLDVEPSIGPRLASYITWSLEPQNVLSRARGPQLVSMTFACSITFSSKQ